MSARTAETLTRAVPPCTSNGTARPNGTCADPTDAVFRSFSSTVVLLVLVGIIAGTILVSLGTFLLHRSKMRKRKIQRAQEEYERDSCRPKPLRGKPTAKHCMMERATSVQKSHQSANKAASSGGVGNAENVRLEHTRHTSQTPGNHLLESVAVS